MASPPPGGPVGVAPLPGPLQAPAFCPPPLWPLTSGVKCWFGLIGIGSTTPADACAAPANRTAATPAGTSQRRNRNVMDPAFSAESHTPGAVPTRSNPVPRVGDTTHHRP